MRVKFATNNVKLCVCVCVSEDKRLTENVDFRVT